MTPQQVIALLKEPEELMRLCFLAIAGGSGHTGPNGQAQLATFGVAVDDSITRVGFTTGLSGYQGEQKLRPVVRIKLLTDPNDPIPLAARFQAYYIPMVQVLDVPNGTSHYTLPTTGQITTAITSQLTGCVFSLGSDGQGAVMASHIQPPQMEGALGQAAALLAAERGFTASGGEVGSVTHVRHGRHYDKFTDQASIVGQLRDNRWHFYMQKLTLDGMHMAVRSAAKIV